MPRMTLAELEALMDQHFQGWRSFSSITALGENDITLTMPFRKEPHARRRHDFGARTDGARRHRRVPRHARSRGTGAGAATANLDIHFLVRPKPEDIIATATMLRLGRRLAVSKVDLLSGNQLVAHATVSYALPPS